MAEDFEKDPIVSRSYTKEYLVATVLLVLSLLWALYDEGWGQRPWKSFQHEFRTRYAQLLKQTRSLSAKSEEEIKKSAGYQELDSAYQQVVKEIEPKTKEIQRKIGEEIEPKIAAVQIPFTDARAHIAADTYDLETTTSKSSRDSKLKKLEDYKSRQSHTVDHKAFAGKKFSYYELEKIYEELKAEKAALVAQLGEAMKPARLAQEKRDEYLTDRMSTLTPEQLSGLQRKYDEWTPAIRQINVADANIVDRCESCHMGAREPVRITPALMTGKGAKPDQYSRAFVSHPDPELLKIHDPEKFGCSTCHQGNGRATSSVQQGHGQYKHWLWPLYAKENVESGCQTCHGADMVLPGASTINQGKDLFRQRGCNGCHRYEGYDTEPEQLLSIGQQIKQVETQKKENLKRAALLSKQGDEAEDNAEAQKFYQQAEKLKLDVSHLEGRIEQLDLLSRSVLRDMKKIGPNLKEVRLKLNKDWIPAWVHKPTDFRPATKMPNFRLNDEQVQSISAYLWQTALKDALPKRQPGNATRGKELFETRGCMACHSMGEGDAMQGGDFAANLTRVGEKANYDYLVRWIHNPRQRTRPYCPYEKRDIGPEDYAKKGLPYVFDDEHSQCPNDGHELQVQNMTVMPILRLTEQDAQDIATYLMGQKKQEPGSYAQAAFMDDPALKDKGKQWIRHFGCAGCHEIAGFEEEGRIGTELTQEGSKPIERLDFALLTHPAMQGHEAIEDKTIQERLPNGPAKSKWYNHKGFFEHKLAKPDVYDKDKVKTETEKLRMPDPHLSKQQVNALVTFLLGSQETSLPASYLYRPKDERRDVQEGWWIVKKYNCMGCHQFLPGQKTALEQIPRYQDPDWKEQLPPKLLTEGARANPEWLMHFLHNPALSEKDLDRNGVRPYLKVRMPSFNFSPNELRKLVRFFQALEKQPIPYVQPPMAALTAKEMEMARSLFTSVAAPCLKCHATGDPAHDRTATAPNFLLAKERLKPGWTERWIIDPQSISPGTSMPSGLFRKEGSKWVFSGPTPPSFQGYDQDHTKLLVRYMMQLTPEEQRRVSGGMGRASAATKGGGTASSGGAK